MYLYYTCIYIYIYPVIQQLLFLRVDSYLKSDSYFKSHILKTCQSIGIWFSMYEIEWLTMKHLALSSWCPPHACTKGYSRTMGTWPVWICVRCILADVGYIQWHEFVMVQMPVLHFITKVCIVLVLCDWLPNYVCMTHSQQPWACHNQRPAYQTYDVCQSLPNPFNISGARVFGSNLTM